MNLSVRSFYDKGGGDSLVNPSFFSPEVRHFLRTEEAILCSIIDFFDLLIEVGCMHGRYLEWAMEKRKMYVGIDIVARFIEEGRRRVLLAKKSPADYGFVEGNAEKISQAIFFEKLRTEKDRSLLFFPFNSFGNMKSVEAVILSIKSAGAPFLISSYQTTKRANTIRAEYYKRCGQDNLECKADEEGVCFYSADGLRSIAYHPSYLQRLFRENNLNVAIMFSPPLGVFYYNPGLEIKK